MNTANNQTPIGNTLSTTNKPSHSPPDNPYMYPDPSLYGKGNQINQNQLRPQDPNQNLDTGYGNSNPNGNYLTGVNSQNVNHPVNTQNIAVQNIEQVSMVDHEKETTPEFEPSNFLDKQTRLGFIKKVFGILAVQLFVTFMVCLIPILSDDFRMFMKEKWYLAIIAGVIAIIFMYVLIYSKVNRKVPANYILLFIFTFCEAYLVAFITTRYDPQTVGLAAGLTTVVVTTLSLYAAFTKRDFTKCGGFLFICLIVLMTGGIMAYFFRNKILNLVVSCLGVIIFGLYLMFDIQLLIGNKKKKLQKDDYILAAMMLYIDIIQIFIYLLQIIGGSGSS